MKRTEKIELRVTKLEKKLLEKRADESGWLAREEIEEFEKIGWKWTRTERKNEMIALNLNQSIK